MFGSKKEIYTGKYDDNCRQITAKLKDSGIRFDIKHQDSHMSDIGRGAGVGRFGESGANDIVSILVKKDEYDKAQAVLRGS